MGMNTVVNRANRVLAQADETLQVARGAATHGDVRGQSHRGHPLRPSLKGVRSIETVLDGDHLRTSRQQGGGDPVLARPRVAEVRLEYRRSQRLERAPVFEDWRKIALVANRRDQACSGLAAASGDPAHDVLVCAHDHDLYSGVEGLDEVCEHALGPS
jgi:hypothetical protein